MGIDFLEVIFPETETGKTKVFLNLDKVQSIVWKEWVKEENLEAYEFCENFLKK